MRHSQIEKGLRKALHAFQQEVTALEERADSGQVSLHAAIEPPVKLYARIIRIHPFTDGNGRTAWAVFCYAMLRCGLLLVAIPPTAESRWALGSAIRADRRQEFQSLVDIVEQTIRESST